MKKVLKKRKLNNGFTACILSLGFLTVNQSNLKAQSLHNYDNQNAIYSKDGKVGISTSNPSAKLQVNSIRPILFNNNGGDGVYGSEIGFNAKLNTGVTPNKFIKLGGTNQRGGAAQVVDHYGNMFFQMYDGSTLSEKTINYKPQIVFRNNGNVGIGTTKPVYLLDIKNTSTTSGGAVRISALNGQIRLFETDDPNSTSHFTQIERNGGNFHIFQYNGSAYNNVLSAGTGGNLGIGRSPNNAVQALIHANDDRIGLCLVSNNIAHSYGVKLIANNAQHKAFAINTKESGGHDVFRVMGDGHIWATELTVDLAKDFPDYVFADNYKLMPLNEVEKFVDEHSHLPNVPSAKEVKEDGMNVGDMQVIQMEKIEELTLYIIDQQKEIKALKSQNDQFLQLNARIEKLESTK